MRIVDNDISMTRGDSETITVSCTDIDGLNLPMVTGDTIYFTIKENTRTTTKILQKVVTSFTDGKAIITLLPTDTKTLQYKQYFYDIQLTRADGTITTIIRPNKFTITEEVTYE